MDKRAGATLKPHRAQASPFNPLDRARDAGLKVCNASGARIRRGWTVMESVEMAKESMEHAHAHGGGGADVWTKRAAILASSFAALAVIIEMSANHAQTSYLAHHVTANDVWAQYQAKSVRRAVYSQAADTIEAMVPSLPDAAKAAIDKARREAARMQNEPGADGMQQLRVKAEHEEHARDHEVHVYEQYERAARGLQSAVVLSGLFMVTRMRWLLIGGASIGGIGLAWAVATLAGVV